VAAGGGSRRSSGNHHDGEWRLSGDLAEVRSGSPVNWQPSSGKLAVAAAATVIFFLAHF